MSDMTTQTTKSQERYVLTSDANGITTYDIVGECVPSLQEIEEWVAPRLRELGVTQAMFAGEFVRAAKWGDARLSDDLYLVVISDREYSDFTEISYASHEKFKVFLEFYLWETKSFRPGSNVDALGVTHYAYWKVIAL